MQNLSKKYFLNNRITALIPEGFSKMDTKTLEATYPIAARRPKEVFSNTNHEVTISFNVTEENIQPNQLEEYRTNVFTPQFTHPNIRLEKNGIEKINGVEFIVLAFSLSIAQQDLYNLLFVSSLKGKLFLGAFNCPLSELTEWQSIADNVLHSVEMV